MVRPLLTRTLRALTWISVVTAVCGSAHGLIVPMTGWVPVNGDANVWTDATGTCVMREERSGQAFPAFSSPADARAFALKLQATLDKRVDAVVTQPIDRAGTWGVLAAYDYVQGGERYRVSQLYLSDRGILRTITGSSAATGTDACVNAMRDFIRYLAN